MGLSEGFCNELQRSMKVVLKFNVRNHTYSALMLGKYFSGIKCSPLWILFWILWPESGKKNGDWLWSGKEMSHSKKDNLGIMCKL